MAQHYIIVSKLISILHKYYRHIKQITPIVVHMVYNIRPSAGRINIYKRYDNKYNINSAIN